MVGESWPNWRQCVEKTLALAPDSITIYQMELPFNTTFSKELQGKDEGGRMKDEGGRMKDEGGRMRPGRGMEQE